MRSGAALISRLVARLEGPIARGLEMGRARRLGARLKDAQCVGEGGRIDPTTVIDGVEGLILGNNVHIGSDGHIVADGGIEIGDNAHVSRRVVIYSSDHDFRRGDLLPYGPHRTRAPVVIGRNVWIGMNAMILPGITIGEGAIVAMGAIVTRDVPPFAIVAQPASRIVGEREAGSYRALEAAGAYGGRSGWPPGAEVQAGWPQSGARARPDLVFVTGLDAERLGPLLRPLAGPDTAVVDRPRPQLAAWCEAFIAGRLDRAGLTAHLARLFGESLLYRTRRHIEGVAGLGGMADPLLEAVPFARLVCLTESTTSTCHASGSRLIKVALGDPQTLLQRLSDAIA